jgi:hypothetical protein
MELTWSDLFPDSSLTVLPGLGGDKADREQEAGPENPHLGAKDRPKKAQKWGGIPAGNGEIRANFVAALGPGWPSAASWEGIGVTGLNMRRKLMRTLKDLAVQKSHFFGSSSTM